MIPNLKMGYYHQREYLERPCNIQMSEKLVRKPLKESMVGFEYSSLLTSKTYSILSYVVGGFVGSKSQMNNNKHNLSYDLSAAVFNLLNPCKYEKEKNGRKSNENFYNTASKLSSEGYDKYIVRSSQKNKMTNLGLEWLEDYVLGFNEQCYNTNQMGKNFDCDEKKDFNDMMIDTVEENKLNEFFDGSIDVTCRVSVCGNEPQEKESLNHSVNFLKPCERFRQQSECSVESTDSESFIVFDGPNEDEEKNIGHSWRLDSPESDSEDDESDSCSDECDIGSVDNELAEANYKWQRNYEDVETRDDEGQRKVRFNDDVKVNKIVAWDYAYRAARPGPWEQMARDRARFRERILRLSSTISPILKIEHRNKIYKELHS